MAAGADEAVSCALAGPANIVPANSKDTGMEPDKCIDRSFEGQGFTVADDPAALTAHLCASHSYTTNISRDNLE